MEVRVSEINKLRQETGSGLMDCKKALVEADGNFDEAITILRKKGQKVSALRAGKEANEGVAIAKTTEDGKSGAVVALMCETDFVAKNEDFVGFAQSVLDTAINNNIKNMDDLLAADLDGLPIKERLAEQVGKIGENIQLSSYEVVEGESVIAYNHAGYKIGVLVALSLPVTDEIKAIGKDIAMQIAAMNPVAIDKDGVDSSVIDKEVDIAKEQARAEGKPENIVEKIAMGRLNKFYNESTLLNQAFVKDTSKTVKKVLEEVDKDLRVLDFKRVSVQQ